MLCAASVVRALLHLHGSRIKGKEEGGGQLGGDGGVALACLSVRTAEHCVVLWGGSGTGWLRRLEAGWLAGPRWLQNKH